MLLYTVQASGSVFKLWFHKATFSVAEAVQFSIFINKVLASILKLLSTLLFFGSLSFKADTFYTEADQRSYILTTRGKSQNTSFHHL